MKRTILATALIMVVALVLQSGLAQATSTQEPTLILQLTIPSTARVVDHDNGIYVVGTSGGDLYVINEEGEYTVTQLEAGSINDVRIENTFIAVAAYRHVIELELVSLPDLTPTELWRTTLSGWREVVSTDLSEDGDYVCYLARRTSSYTNAGEVGVLGGGAGGGSLISRLYASGYYICNWWLDATGDMEYIAASQPMYGCCYKVGVALYHFDGSVLTMDWWKHLIPRYETTEVRVSENKDYVAVATSSGTYMKFLRLSDGAILWSHETPGKEQFACDGDVNLEYVIGATQAWSSPYPWFVLRNLGASYEVLAQGIMVGGISDLDANHDASLLAFGSNQGEFLLLSRSNGSVDTVYSATVDSISRAIDAIEIGSHTLLVGGPQFIHVYGPGTPMLLKELAINKLEFILAVDVNDADLIDAIGYLHMSLGEDDERAGMSGSEVVWGDPTHIDDCHGGYKGVDVFQYEEEACDKLEAYLENEENVEIGVVPDSIIFEVLNTSCAPGDSFQFFLNGIFLCATTADPTYGCTCTPPIQTVSITDAGLLGSAWNVGSENTFRFVKTVAAMDTAYYNNNALAWVRVQIEAGVSTEILCIFDFDGGNCSEMDLCNAGYTWGQVDKSVSWLAPSARLLTEVQAVREMLARADSMLADVAIADAIAQGGDPDDIAVAQALKAEGDAAKAAGGTEICDVALDKYEEAWEKAAGSWCEHLSKVSGPSTPKVFALAQNYPNPFNPVTQISYTLPRDAHVKLEIYNLLGQKVTTLVDEYQEAGQKSVIWEAKDLASGIYFYKLSSGDFTATRKMVLTR